ncbi:anion permease [Marimonas lutisalis]|uniref:anion permease n=1 Tax=Marimonas lutisalis TaxID=2545756 RepID=UPI0010F9DB53|nr:anion permease [Marimonas lutisalis]
MLTQPLSNAAAALTMLPIAIALADNLGVDPRPLAIIVTLSASLSFIAPLEPALLLVYGRGNYRLLDFVRAGVPLTVVSLAIVLLLVPWIWPV